MPDTLHLSVSDPDNPLDAPIFDGPLPQAVDRLRRGAYVATADDDGTEHYGFLVVSEAASFECSRDCGCTDPLATL